MKDKVFIVVYGVLFVVLLDFVNETAPFLVWTFSALFCIGYFVYRQAYIRMWKSHGYATNQIPDKLSIPFDMLYFGANLIRVWRLHRTLIEIMLPPHLICPPELDELSFDQWRKIANDYWPARHDGERNGKWDDKWHSEWLPAQGLPPLPAKKMN